MADNHGGVSWYIRLLMDKRSQRQVEEELKKTGQRGGADLGKGADQETRKGLQDILKYVRGIFGLQLAREFGNALRTVGQTINAFVRRGGELDRLREGFDSLTARAGIAGDAMLTSMRKASRGMVSDMELMRQANFALQVGLPVTAQSMGELVLISRRLAEATGGDAAEAFQRLVQGIAKGEVEILEELGLLTRVGDANKAYAAAHDRSVDSLSEHERRLAFFNAVMTEAREKVQGMGEDQLDAAERLDQLVTFWDNLNDAVALAVLESPNVEAFFEGIGVGAENAGERVQELANYIGALVDSYGGHIWQMLTTGAKGMLAGGAAGGLTGVGLVPGGIIGGMVGAARGYNEAVGRGANGSFESNLSRRRAEQLAASTNANLLAFYRGRGGATVPVSDTVDPKALENAKKQAEKILEAFDQSLREGAVRTGVAGGAGSLSAEGREASLAARAQRGDFRARGGRLTSITVPGGGGLVEPRQLGAFEGAYMDMLYNVESASQSAAHAISGAFENAFDLMRQEGATLGSFFQGLGEGIAGSILNGIAQMAGGKAAENVAWAIEAGARALGFGALLSPGQAAAASASAGQHLAAAAAWGALAGGASAGGRAVGGNRGGGYAASPYDQGLDRTGRMESRPIVLQLDVNGILDPSNPVIARGIGESMDLNVRLAGPPRWSQ